MDDSPRNAKYYVKREKLTYGKCRGKSWVVEIRIVILFA